MKNTSRKPYRTLSDLPFVAKSSRRQRRKNWVVKNTNDDALACARGQMFGAQFALYLTDNPTKVGMPSLNRIIADMNLSDDAENMGYAIGFCSYLERLIHFAASQFDTIADANELIAEYELSAVVSLGRVQ